MHAFDWQNPYPSIHTPVFARNVVATSHPLAVQAGLRMLQKGGNAVDAAVAGVAMMVLVEPVSCGLGGDCFAIVWDGHELHGLNASGGAPAAWNVDYFKRKYGVDGNGLAIRPKFGWDAVTVPGVVAGWAALHAKFGKLPFADVLEPAIDVAERGYVLTPFVVSKWTRTCGDLRDQPGFAAAFLPHGRAPEVGEKFVLPGAAQTLRRIARTRGRDLYEGESAERIAAFSRQCGGAMTAADLRAYRPEWVTPLTKDYHGFSLHELPPNGQGIAALMALGIAGHFDLQDLPVDSAESQHIQIEATKLAFADLYRYAADARSMKAVTPADLLDDAYLASRARLLRRDRASQVEPGQPAAGGTIYLAAADEHGMMVSFIQSNYMGFGSGVVVPDTGISLQNRGVGFSMDPRSPNVVAGGKRPFHTIIPGFLTRAGQPVMAFGVMGGDIQPQAHLQTLVRMVDYGQQPQAACDAPRWKVNADGSVDVEKGTPPELIEGLRKLGHAVRPAGGAYVEFGAGQFIWKLADEDPDMGYVAASDPRRDGQAAGF